ncbi:MAG: T9SS type A sorting domain-containing protein [bacterium]
MKTSRIFGKDVLGFVTMLILATTSLYAQNGTTGSSRLHNLIVAKGDHTLMNEQGVIWSWGFNDTGQLGDGTTTNRSLPVQVGSSFSGVIGMGAGKQHSIALKSDGTVWTWGDNSYGQLGDATTTQRTSPVQVKGSGGTGNLTAIATIQGGDHHSIALKDDGTVWAWGRNQYGALGDNSTTQRTSPVQVKGVGGTGNLTNVKAIAGGGLFSLALKADGTVWAWGRNDKGQLGDNSTTDSSTPVQVKGAGGTGNLTNVAAIHAGYAFSIAMKADGTVWAWGSNVYGQLGDNTTTDSSVPVQVKGSGGTGNLTNVAELSGGAQHGLVIKGDGTVWAWGRNQKGQLGDNTTTNRSTPVQVSSFSNAVTVAGGIYHSVAFKSDGTIWTWGYNEFGQLGDNSTTDKTIPVLAAGLTGVIQIAAGGRHSLALRTDGSLRSWGFNYYFQLGDGTSTDRKKPIQVINLNDVKKIAGGDAHSLVLKSDGTLRSWGQNLYAALGDNTFNGRKIPVQVVSLADVVRVSAGGWFSVALKTDGTVWAWGHNASGQVGEGGIDTSFPAPVQTSTINKIIDVTTGFQHAIALNSDGTVWTWGDNTYGQLGDGSTTDRYTPVQISGLANIIAIAGGKEYSLAVKSDGTIWAWGRNHVGQLGDNSTTDRINPVQVSGLTNAVAVAAGHYASYAVKSDGSIWAWGYNAYGQLGDGTSSNRLTAVQATGVSGVFQVLSGYEHSLIAKDTWDVFATGGNSWGQLGDGSTSNRTTYTATVGLKSNAEDLPTNDFDDDDIAETPKSFALYQNYPNPFNPSTKIKFALPNDRLVTLQVFNTLGIAVATLYYNKRLETGQHEIGFDGKGLPSGTYIYKIVTLTDEGAREVIARKMLLFK